MTTSLFSGTSLWAGPLICLLLLPSTSSCLNLLPQEPFLGPTSFENPVSRSPKQEALCELLQGWQVCTDQALLCKTHGSLSLEPQDSPVNTATNMMTTHYIHDTKGGPFGLGASPNSLDPPPRCVFLSFWFLFPRPGLPSPEGMTVAPQMADFQTIEFQNTVVSEQLACNEGQAKPSPMYKLSMSKQLWNLEKALGPCCPREGRVPGRVPVHLTFLLLSA